ncbi:MAG: hypothetical protein U0869_06615 [Chloroflexota bacterium]
MNDGYLWWLVVLGIAIGAAVVWLTAVRLPRKDDDVSGPERAAEARYIAATIERDGGVAPVELVEEILDLHSAYLASGGTVASSAIATEDPAAG